jgi:hypothetical protein
MDFETHDRRVIEELERQVADLQSRLDAQIAGHRKTAKDATDNLIRANEAERALAERAGGATHRHKKRGTEYVLIGIGKMQCDWWQIVGDGTRYPVDMREVAIYRSVDDDSLWARPREEFEDGRFETLSTEPAAPEGRQDDEPRAYIVHAPEDDHYGTGSDRLQFHPLAQHDLNNGYRQTPLYTRPTEQVVTEAGVEAAARYITKWLGFAWDSLHDGRVTDRGFPILTHGQFGWGFQGHKVDMIDLARAALKAAMEAGR